jgi:hypothetical protein
LRVSVFFLLITLNDDVAKQIMKVISRVEKGHGRVEKRLMQFFVGYLRILLRVSFKAKDRLAKTDLLKVTAFESLYD